MIQGKMSEGKMSEGKMSEGKMSEGKMNATALHLNDCQKSFSDKHHLKEHKLWAYFNPH